MSEDVLLRAGAAARAPPARGAAMDTSHMYQTPTPGQSWSLRACPATLLTTDSLVAYPQECH